MEEQLELFELGAPPQAVPAPSITTLPVVLDEQAFHVIEDFARQEYINRAHPTPPKAIIEALGRFLIQRGITPSFLIKW